MTFAKVLADTTIYHGFSWAIMQCAHGAPSRITAVCRAVYHAHLLLLVAGCRTRWLAPGGIILPDAAQLYVTGVDDRQYLGEQSKLWGNRRMGPGDGFAVKPVLNAVIKHPRVDSMTRSQVVTDAQQLLSLDLYSASLQVGGLRHQPAVLVDGWVVRVAGA